MIAARVDESSREAAPRFSAAPGADARASSGAQTPTTGYYAPPPEANFDAADPTQVDWLAPELKSEIEKEWPSEGDLDHLLCSIKAL
jgi:hypothetical protein